MLCHLRKCPYNGLLCSVFYNFVNHFDRGFRAVYDDIDEEGKHHYIALRWNSYTYLKWVRGHLMTEDADEDDSEGRPAKRSRCED